VKQKRGEEKRRLVGQVRAGDFGRRQRRYTLRGRGGGRARALPHSPAVYAIAEMCVEALEVFELDTRRFRNLLAPYELRGPVNILPDVLPLNRAFNATSNLDQPPNCTPPQQRLVSPNHPMGEDEDALGVSCRRILVDSFSPPRGCPP
jgi:hypothetical protein